MAIDLYWGSGSPFSWRVLLTLELTGAEYRSKLLEFSKGEHRSPDYLKLNPRGKVPTLRDGDFVLGESLAIMVYLDQRFPEPGLFGHTPQEAGRVWSQLLEFRNYAEPAFDRMIRPILFGGLEDESEEVRVAAKELHGEFERLEAALTIRAWLVGELLSAADVAVYPFYAFARRVGARADVAPLALGFEALGSRYPAIAAWSRRIEALPGYERTYPPHWRAAS